MHFLLTYGVVETPVPNIGNLKNTFEGIIMQKPNYRALSNTFIIRIDSQTEWQELLTKLINLTKNNGESIHFIATPLMHGGRYNGFVPQNSWQNINKLTDS